MATIKLQSAEGQVFEISAIAAQRSKLIENMLLTLGFDESDDPIHFSNITSEILQRVVEWCNQHVDDLTPIDKYVVSEWDAEFCNVPQDILFGMMIAADFLNIKDLYEATMKTVTDMIKGKTPEQLRELFNLPDDLSPEEKEQIRKENPWGDETV